MYDFGSLCSGVTQGNLKVNYVGNYIRAGASSKGQEADFGGSAFRTGVLRPRQRL